MKSRERELEFLLLPCPRKAPNRRKKEEKSWLLPVTLHSSLCCLENKTFNYCFSVSVLGFCLLRNFFLVPDRILCDCFLWLHVYFSCLLNVTWKLQNLFCSFLLVHNCWIRHNIKCFVHALLCTSLMFLLWLICLLFHCCTLFSFWCGALCSMIALLCLPFDVTSRFCFQWLQTGFQNEKALRSLCFSFSLGRRVMTTASTLLHWCPTLFFVRLPWLSIPDFCKKSQKTERILCISFLWSRFCLTRKFYWTWQLGFYFQDLFSIHIRSYFASSSPLDAHFVDPYSAIERSLSFHPHWQPITILVG